MRAEGCGIEVRAERGPGVPGSLSQTGLLRKQTLRQICGQKFYWEGLSGATPAGGVGGEQGRPRGALQCRRCGGALTFHRRPELGRDSWTFQPRVDPAWVQAPWEGAGTLGEGLP